MKPILFAAALALSLPVQAADPAKGKELVTSKGCVACHGAMGDKPSAPDQPVLAGQYNDYLVHALGDYKSGKRTNPIMKGMAATLSKQDIEDVAAWFSSQKSTPLHNQR
jgi:cytochrome c553